MAKERRNLIARRVILWAGLFSGLIVLLLVACVVWQGWQIRRMDARVSTVRVGDVEAEVVRRLGEPDAIRKRAAGMVLRTAAGGQESSGGFAVVHLHHRDVVSAGLMDRGTEPGRRGDRHRTVGLITGPRPD